MPGATYQVQAYTVFDNRESLAYISHNFTTSKSVAFTLLFTHLRSSAHHSNQFKNYINMFTNEYFFLVSNPNANNPPPPSDTCLHILQLHHLNYILHSYTYMYKTIIHCPVYSTKMYKNN